MATTIKLKNSVTTTNAPSSLVQGEVAINITDKKVWVGNAATTPIQLLGAGSSASFGALTCTSLTNSGLTSGRVTYASTGGLLADSANFTFNGTTVTMANDASISGLTVGKGGGAVSTNTAVGAVALASNTTGLKNVAVGGASLYSNTSGNSNTSSGWSALISNTTGSNNAAYGESALTSNTTGSANTSLGYQSLINNTTASNNTAVGYQAGYSNTTGTLNVAIGHTALYSNTTADASVAIGYEAAYTQTTGALYTVAIGYRALKANTSGSQNNGLGFQALTANTTGSNNTGFGTYALASNTTASTSSAFGNEALRFNTTGASNTAVGYQSLVNNTTASNNTAVGYQAAYSNTTGTQNTVIGYQAGYNATGSYMTALGYRAGYANTDASLANTFIGRESGLSNTSGGNITTVGNASLQANTTGNNNSALGNSALYTNTTGSNNTAVGNSALEKNTTATRNTAVGYQAGYALTTGGANVVVGDNAFKTATTADNTVAIGTYALENTTGIYNTAVGAGAGGAITSGAKNTIIGRYNGNQGGLDIRTASNYIVLSDGDGNPRGIFDNNGTLIVGGTTTNPATNVVYANPEVGGQGMHLVVGKVGTTGSCLYLNRESNDGTLVEFRQANINEGTISVSGSTVSYNGGHLSRYSQLPSNQKDDTLLKGTVMSNLDDMCVWTKDGEVLPNEQLNKMKVSDVEGDTNVAGVFVNWTFDEQCQSDDMNVAMTGDMIIRIAQGVVVQKGDLLMSAGDGTAKPQGDDIRRSKTVAKVTSNHVTCTYEDGSYCVPCVLMAC